MPTQVIARSICYLIAASVSVSTLAVGAVEFFNFWHVRPVLNSDLALQKKYLTRYRDDLVFLAKLDLFKNDAQTHADAGPVLNSKVYWSPQNDKVKDELKSGSHSLLVPLADREAILRLRAEWIRKFDRARQLHGDLSVFAELTQYDHWDLETASPIAALIEKHEFVPPTRLPLPEGSDLLAVAKLRLMTGALHGELLPALSDVRQLARLLLTTEATQLVLTGLVLLDYERYAYQFFIEERGLDPHSWTPVDRSVTRRAHRAILATRNYLHAWTPSNMIEEIFLKPPGPIELCASLNDAIAFEYTMRSGLYPSWPFETSFHTQYEQMAQILTSANGRCRLRYLHDLLAHPELLEHSPRPLILSRLPYARKVFALNLSVRKFADFSAYENNEN